MADVPARPFFTPAADRPVHVAIFLSGSGSNAERIIEYWRQPGNDHYRIVCLVTDRPETSRAHELGRRFNLPLIANDIRRFYHDRGETRISIATPRGQRLRREWTDAVRAQLAGRNIDFALLAGFVPLTNLTADFPCLNVHPGDLTYVKNNRRLLVGLHTIPIERAILEGLDHLRASVIIAQPYAGDGTDDMDSGPILGLSPAVPIDLQGRTREELAACAAARPQRRPRGGFRDALSAVAAYNQERLKQGGDWIVFPPTVAAFAAGRYAADANDRLLYRVGKRWQPVHTVEFGAETAAPLPR